jgi:hypothetical protein
MSWTDIHIASLEELAVTVTITPRRPAAARAFCLPTVREIPPVPRPGTFDSTW